MNQFTKICFFLFLAFGCYLFPSVLFAQSGNSQIVAEFDSVPLIIKQGDVISKTLKVINGGNKDVSFTINVTYPGGWHALLNTGKSYTISPNDTFYIPVRIVPKGKIKGNTKYLIYAYIINNNNVPIASSHFFAERNKIVNWTLDVGPYDKIYLKNGETTADFSLNVFNTGNELEELTLDMSNYRKDRIILMDTNGRILKTPFYTFSLLPNEDTTFHYRAQYTQGLRHFRLIDTEGYRPNKKDETQKYSIFAKSHESLLTSKGAMMKAKKIDFIRLADEQTINPYAYTSIPLIMDINIANLLGNQPIMNAMFMGSTSLNNGAYISYYAQTFFSTYLASTQFLTNSFFNIGYYDKKYNVQIGNVGGFGGGGGKGISGNYIINRHESVGGFFTRGQKFIDADKTAVGIRHHLSFSKIRMQNYYTHVVNSKLNFNIDYLRNNITYALTRKHSIAAGATLSKAVWTNSASSNYGYSINGAYSGVFFKNVLRSGISGTYATGNFGGTIQGASLSLMHNSNIALKKWNIRLVNRYQKRDSVLNRQQQQISISNIANFNRKLGKANFAPSIFYDISEIGPSRFHSRGLIINYSTMDYETTRMTGLNIKAGYNKALDIPGLKDYFFFQSFLMFKYRVWSANAGYNYGSIAPTDLSFINSYYTQSVNASVNYQYQFLNPHFILNNSFSYRYLNKLKKHSFGYTPQLFYYTNSGWRFYVMPGYYMSVNRASSSYAQDLGTSKTSVSQSMTISAGIRKEFGIPIPWRKTKYPSFNFVAFIDQNGNNKKDAGEVALENVVIRMGEWEVLTNEKGMATIKNVFIDSAYHFSAFSLVDLNGYFPNIPSTIIALKDSVFLVPFVKGVKVNGNVFIDREKEAAGSEKPLDLSGIRITAINGKTVHTLTDGKGDFSFYVPFGSYTIAMDEKVLGDRFTLLQNNFKLELDQKTESVFVSFYIVEKRRKMKVKRFGQNGELIDSGKSQVEQKRERAKRLEEVEKAKKAQDEKNAKLLQEVEKTKKLQEEQQRQRELEQQKQQLEKSKQEENNKQEVKVDTTKKDNYNYADMRNYNDLDSLVDALLAKSKAENKPLTEDQLMKKEAEEFLNKTYYAVQIGAFGNLSTKTLAKFIVLGNVEARKGADGITRYTVGEFSTYEEAKKAKETLLQKGIEGVFVVGISKGKVIKAVDVEKILKKGK